MTIHKSLRSIILILLVTIMGFGIHAIAGESEKSTRMDMHPKDHPAKCPYASHGKHFSKPDLTEKEFEQFKAEKEAFHNAVKDLQREKMQQHLELRSEMAKKNPDQKKAFAIQKNLSELNAKIDQKRLEHRFRLKNIHPDLGSMMGHGMGHCKGHGKGHCSGGKMMPPGHSCENPCKHKR